MSQSYFSEREQGPRPQNELEFSKAAWGGVVALVEGLIERGAFGIDYPESCPDGKGPIGTDWQMFRLALKAEVPGIDEWLDAEIVPSAPVVMDVLEFCFLHVCEPSQTNYHSFFGHYHLSFRRDEGRAKFVEAANRILERNGLAYQLSDNGLAERLAPIILRESLVPAIFNTGDDQLNEMLETARRKFLSTEDQERRESLEKLWDAWERLKTLAPGQHKKESITNLLDAAADSPLRESLESEAKELTRLGNKLQIRHTEKHTVPVTRDEHVDYLFHRLFALVQLACQGARKKLVPGRTVQHGGVNPQSTIVN